ncbi:MAG: hypothetical protein H8K03_01780 [Nitrospira sp.]
MPQDEYRLGCTPPGWWFDYFEPLWGPFVQRLYRHKNVSVSEFEWAASKVPGLTGIEKTIAVSAFRHQREHAVTPSR